MAPSSSDLKPKMRTLIATETDLPGVFHIPTLSNYKSGELNEMVVKAAITCIDWKSIESKN